MTKTGEQKLQWVTDHMPILAEIEKRFKKDKPFKGLRISVCIHLEAKTARLCEVLKNGGAQVFLSGCNPLSTQDDVAQAIAKKGITVYAKHGCSVKEYNKFIEQLVICKPNIIIDDGGDVVEMIHKKYPEYIKYVIGGGEETTTGVRRLQHKMKNGQLKFPMILVNEAMMKYLFDNRYGTGQSVWTAIMATTNLVIASKTVVVAGYGWCGKGVAMRAKALGAKVIVTEINAVKAIEALMDGFEVMTMDKAAKFGDIFVTVTGCKEVIAKKHFLIMKDGAILTNAGHFNVEVDAETLEKMAVSQRVARNNIVEYTMKNGKKINLIAEGRLVNLASGDGHPAEIMDTSFAIQALCAEYVAKNKLAINIYEVPKKIDEQVARLKLKTMGINIDKLTKEQEKYLLEE